MGGDDGRVSGKEREGRKAKENKKRKKGMKKKASRISQKEKRKKKKKGGVERGGKKEKQTHHIDTSHTRGAHPYIPKGDTTSLFGTVGKRFLKKRRKEGKEETEERGQEQKEENRGMCMKWGKKEIENVFFSCPLMWLSRCS